MSNTAATPRDLDDILRACIECARRVLHHVTPGEDGPRLAIEAAERAARGLANMEELRTAEDRTRYADASAPTEAGAWAAYAARACACAAIAVSSGQLASAELAHGEAVHAANAAEAAAAKVR